jgi:hypothetical protein
MRECEKLDEIFTLQDQRQVSENLTLSHKRVVYVPEDTVENRRVRGRQVTVHEHEDGKMVIRHAGRVLAHHTHPKDVARISQGAIVESKRLGAVLGWIAERQRERDVLRLASKKITLRTKKRIRATAGLTA